MIRKITPKDRINFWLFCDSHKIENSQLLFKKILKYSQEAYIDDAENIRGLLIIEKIDNKQYLKLYSWKLKTAQTLLKTYCWYCNNILYATLASNSPLIRILLKVGFRIYSPKNSPTVELIREKFQKPVIKKDR